MDTKYEKSLERLVIEERRDYFRKWRAENPEKVKQHNANYWRKRALKRISNEKEA